AGGVATLEDDHHAVAGVLHPLLQLAELPLELPQLLLVLLALERLVAARLLLPLLVLLPRSSPHFPGASCFSGSPGQPRPRDLYSGITETKRSLPASVSLISASKSERCASSTSRYAATPPR